MINGQPKDDSANRYPANNGLTAAARLRGTAVALAAAGRSSASHGHHVRGPGRHVHLLTASSRQQQRDRERRDSARTAASIRKRLAGRCVNTIVLIRPNRFATGTAIRNDTAEQMLAQKKIAAAVDTDKPNR